MRVFRVVLLCGRFHVDINKSFKLLTVHCLDYPEYLGHDSERSLAVANFSNMYFCHFPLSLTDEMRFLIYLA